MRPSLVMCACLLACCLDRHREAENLLTSGRQRLLHGEVNQAESLAERGLAIALSAKDPVLEWKFRLLYCESVLRHQPAGKVLAELEKPMPSGEEFAALAARRKMLEGRALKVLKRSKDARNALDAAARLATLANDQQTLREVETLQGSLLMDAEDWDAANQTLRDLMNSAHAAGLPNDEAAACINLGRIQQKRLRYDESVDYLSRATALPVTEPTLHSVAQLNLATSLFTLGQSDRAFAVLTPAIAQLDKSGATRYLQNALGTMGIAYNEAREEARAADYLARALTMAKEIGRADDAALWAGNLAQVHCELQNWDQAERFNRDAIQFKQKAQLPTLAYNTLTAARIANGRGAFVEGARLCHDAISQAPKDPSVLWETHSELARAALKQHKTSEALNEFESAVSIVEQTRADLLHTDYKLSFLTRLIRFYKAYVDALIANGDYTRALAVADSSRAQTLAERFGSAPTRTSRSFVAPQRAGGIILTYWLGAKESHAWVIGSGGVHHVVLAGEAEIAPLVADYSEAIEKRLADPLRRPVASGTRLYQLLIDPVKQWIPVGSRVTIVPDGVLAGLNFETLPVPIPNAHYWIEDATISIGPSIGMMGRSAAEPRGKGLLVIGDPEKIDQAYAPLTSAAREIGDVTRHFPAESAVVLRGPAAKPEAYRKAGPARFNVIHFTAHAVANRESPLDSAVLLTDGKLYAREVYDIPLRASLVTISACRGAGARNYTGEGLVGFAWAFLRAGAHNVIAGLWDVNDQSTAGLMDGVYRELAKGRTPADALRHAKLAMIHSDGNFRKPYYWAPFQNFTVDAP